MPVAILAAGIVGGVHSERHNPMSDSYRPRAEQVKKDEPGVYSVEYRSGGKDMKSKIGNFSVAIGGKKITVSAGDSELGYVRVKPGKSGEIPKVDGV